VLGARGRARDAVEFQSSFSSHSINKEKPNIQEERAPVMPTIPMLGKT